LKKFHIVALPANLYQSFYFIIRKLRSNKIKTVLISDGMADSFNLMKYIFAYKIDSVFNLYKIILYFIFKMNLCNECFFICYPLKASCSKITYPVTKNFLPEKKIIRLIKKNKVKDLILGTRVKMDKIKLKQLIKKRQIKNYCYLERGKKFITINGRVIKLKNIMIAEEILNTNLIKRLHGGVSTSTFYAKINNIKVNLYAEKFKPFFLYYFAKKKLLSKF